MRNEGEAAQRSRRRTGVGVCVPETTETPEVPKFTSPIVPAKRLIVLDHGELQRVVGAQRGRTEKLTAVMVVFDHASVSSIGSEYGWGWHDYQWSQGELVILRKEDHNGAPCCSTLTGHSNPLIQR